MPIELCEHLLLGETAHAEDHVGFEHGPALATRKVRILEAVDMMHRSHDGTQARAEQRAGRQTILGVKYVVFPISGSAIRR